MGLLLVPVQFRLSWIVQVYGNLWSFIFLLHRLEWGLLVSYQHMLWRFMISLLGWLCFLGSKQSWHLLQFQYLMKVVQHQEVINPWLIRLLIRLRWRLKQQLHRQQLHQGWLICLALYLQRSLSIIQQPLGFLWIHQLKQLHEFSSLMCLNLLRLSQLGECTLWTWACIILRI